MEISIAALPTLDLSLAHVLAMPLRQNPQTEVRYDAPGREDHILHYAVSGVRVYAQDGIELLRLRPGDVILLPMNTRYTSWPVGDQDALGYNVRFLLRDEAGRAVGLAGGPQLLLHDGDGRLLPAFCQLSALSMQARAILPAKACLNTLLDEICRNLASPSEESWLSTAMDYMSSHLQGPLSLEEISRACRMGERTLCRKFQAATGKTPAAWHRALRITKAREFLSSGAFTLEATAEALGFTDASHLSHCFLRATGEHPGAIRRATAVRVTRRGKAE